MYLSELLEPYVPQRDLRSADKLLFCQQSYHTKTYGSRAFSVSAPCMWNKLAKCSPGIAIFKHKIKTHLFKLAYHSKFLESFCFYYFLIVYINYMFR